MQPRTCISLPRPQFPQQNNPSIYVALTMRRSLGFAYIISFHLHNKPVGSYCFYVHFTDKKLRLRDVKWPARGPTARSCLSKASMYLTTCSLGMGHPQCTSASKFLQSIILSDLLTLVCTFPPKCSSSSIVSFCNISKNMHYLHFIPTLQMQKLRCKSNKLLKEIQSMMGRSVFQVRPPEFQFPG